MNKNKKDSILVKKHFLNIKKLKIILISRKIKFNYKVIKI